MYKRATERRKRMEEQLDKKAEESLPVYKKSASTPLQRDAHFQRLSMPNPNTRAPKQPFHQQLRTPRGAQEQASTTEDRSRPAWFGGQRRTEAERKGWQAGSIVHARSSAVH
jgi:hypothetical protein